MPGFRHDRFDQVIAENYEGLRAEVLSSVRGKLAVANLHPDPLDLDAAYNAAWHALYEHSRKGDKPVDNLGGWLATIAYRRAIDDVRSAQLKYRAVAADGEPSPAVDGVCESDVDDEITSRQMYHQWLMSVRLRLNAREQQAVSLCVLHEHSRKDASEIMGVDVKRLDKIMIGANKKLGGVLEAISRGDWCLEQRSLIKAYALGLHQEGGERHKLAVFHLAECPACAAYVRSLRGLAGVMPPPALLAGAVGTAGGILATLTSFFGGGGATAGGAGTAAAGGGGATLLGGLGAKAVALCATAACAAGGAIVVAETAPSTPKPRDVSSSPRPAPTRQVSAATPRRASSATAPARSPSSATSKPVARRAKTIAPNPKSKAAQEIAELGIEPQATSTSAPATLPTRAASTPPPAQRSEFSFEGG